MMELSESWVEVWHGDPFPPGAVKALGRGLRAESSIMIDSYIALWISTQEAVFGRASAKDGKVEAVFPVGNQIVGSFDLHSSFYLLTYIGSIHENGYSLKWKPVGMFAPINTSRYRPVRVGATAPAVVNVALPGQEALGCCDLSRGKVYVCGARDLKVFTGAQYVEALVLCIKPKLSTPGGLTRQHGLYAPARTHLHIEDDFNRDAKRFSLPATLSHAVTPLEERARAGSDTVMLRL